MFRIKTVFAIVGVAAATMTFSTSAMAQTAIEIRGGVNVPTFDIADAAKTGPSFGVGISKKATDRLWVIGDFDYGMHANKTSGGPDINVSHYIAKLGWELNKGADSKWTVVLNAGAGAMNFSVDGGPSFTYPAINVGAKLIYGFSERTSFVLSPQGDIAFSKKDELGTNNAWVWPFAAGLRFNF
jgi:hypothetical protein